MGAADVVPGVSGGTIAFITGIYEELIDTINRVNVSTFKLLFQEGIGAFWKEINGNFLVVLFSGIGFSILSLAKLITYLIEHQAIATWSFFFGLVLASVPFVAKNVKVWNAKSFIAIAAGAVFAYYITILPAGDGNNGMLFIFFSAMLAICAMILPGISGSFILLLLGAYTTVLTGIKDLDFQLIAVFGAGALIGLLSFAKVLKIMFAKYHDVTIAILSGFLIGSLNKLWPWKQVLEVFVKHPGETDEKIVPIVEQSVLPGQFTTPVIENGVVVEQVAGDPQLFTAILFMLVGIGLITTLEFAGRKYNTA